VGRFWLWLEEAKQGLEEGSPPPHLSLSHTHTHIHMHRTPCPGSSPPSTCLFSQREWLRPLFWWKLAGSKS
jgi:hypothetical protein